MAAVWNILYNSPNIIKLKALSHWGVLGHTESFTVTQLQALSWVQAYCSPPRWVITRVFWVLDPGVHLSVAPIEPVHQSPARSQSGSYKGGWSERGDSRRLPPGLTCQSKRAALASISRMSEEEEAATCLRLATPNGFTQSPFSNRKASSGVKKDLTGCGFYFVLSVGFPAKTMVKYVWMFTASICM